MLEYLHLPKYIALDLGISSLSSATFLLIQINRYFVRYFTLCSGLIAFIYNIKSRLVLSAEKAIEMLFRKWK